MTTTTTRYSKLTKSIDGLNQSDQPTFQNRGRSPSTTTTTSSHNHTRSPSPPAGSSSSRVQWIPLSPQSSQTLLRHRAQSRSRDNVDREPTTDDDDERKQSSKKPAPDSDDNDNDAASAIVPANPQQQQRRFRKRPRRNASDPSMDRPLTTSRGHHRGGRGGPSNRTALTTRTRSRCCRTASTRTGDPSTALLLRIRGEVGGGRSAAATLSTAARAQAGRRSGVRGASRGRIPSRWSG